MASLRAPRRNHLLVMAKKLTKTEEIALASSLGAVAKEEGFSSCDHFCKFDNYKEPLAKSFPELENARQLLFDLSRSFYI